MFVGGGGGDKGKGGEGGRNISRNAKCFPPFSVPPPLFPNRPTDHCGGGGGGDAVGSTPSPSILLLLLLRSELRVGATAVKAWWRWSSRGSSAHIFRILPSPPRMHTKKSPFSPPFRIFPHSRKVREYLVGREYSPGSLLLVGWWYLFFGKRLERAFIRVRFSLFFFFFFFFFF